MLRIAILDDYQNCALGLADWTVLSGTEQTVFTEHLGAPERAAPELADFDVIVAMRERTPFPPALLDQLPRLKLLITTAPANAAIDVRHARARGIEVCGTRYLVHPTVEHTWALILSAARNICAEDAGTRAGRWQQSVGTDLFGQTLGVAGLGTHGTEVARIGLAFGMRVIAWSANLTPQRAADAGVEYVVREELFAESDILTLHLVLSDRTRGLVGERELLAMKPSAILVNTSRGPMVDEGALAQALTAGQMRAAALDVFDGEPLRSGSPLLNCPGLTLSPHLGFVTEKMYRMFYGDAVEDIAAFLAGQPIRLVPA